MDYTLGHAFDKISRYGASELLRGAAFETALEKNLLVSLNYLDTKSLSIQGEYDIKEEASVIEITYGYSKDHSP